MYQGTFCIESVPPWIAITPPPARTNACRFENSTKFSPAAFRPTVEFRTIVLYCWSVARSRNGFVVSETPGGACRPGDVLAGGSQMSTSKPFSAPSFWNIACASTIAWWRKPPALPLTRILYVAPGVATNGVGFQNTRIAWSPGSAGPTVTPVPVVSTVPPFTWLISACAALLSAARSAVLAPAGTTCWTPPC